MKKIAIFIIFVFSVIGTKAQVFQEWTARYNGVDSLFDGASAIDAHSCIYVTGTTMQFNQAYNRYENHIVILRYNQNGTTLWAVVDTNIEAYARNIVTDNNCNIYTTGSRNINGNVDFFTSKYDSAGVKQWEAVYDNPQHNYDEVNSIAIDNTGSNIYVGGNSTTGTTLIKYSSSGVEQWVANYNVNTGMSSPQIYAIAIDASNNIYVTGVRATTVSQADYLTIKYNNSGVQQWVAFYNGPSNGNDAASAIAIDKNDNIYVTGTSWDINTSSDFATVKYNKNGILQWVARYNDAANGDDNAIAIAVDGKGNIDVFGSYNTSLTGSGYATVQYSKNGTVKWVQLYNGPTLSTIPEAMTLDTAGNIYVTGMSGDMMSTTVYDYATIKYLQKGDLAWVMRYNGNASGFDYAKAIAVDTRENVYVTGASQGTGTGFDMVTVKYSDISNSNNPFDFVGKYHNMGLDYLYLNKDSIAKDSIIRLLDINKIMSIFICNNENDIIVKSQKAFNNIKNNSSPNSNECGMQKMEYDYLKVIIIAIKSIDTNDNVNSLKTFINKITDIEGIVLNNNSLGTNVNAKILMASSIARYSITYWFIQTSDGAKSAPKKWWKWLIIGAADVIGFVATSESLDPLFAVGCGVFTSSVADFFLQEK